MGVWKIISDCLWLGRECGPCLHNLGSRRRFDPTAFFETAAKGRTISKHRKGEIIFSQGDDANPVF